jgi:chemotaxis protein MotB
MKSWYGFAIIVVFVGVTGCGRPENEYQARLREIQQLQGEASGLRSERTRLQDQLRGLRASAEAMASRLRELGEDVTRLQRVSAETQSELEAARRREQDAAQRIATFRQMIARFQAMINSGRLRVRIVRGRMVIELPAGILFESGDARLRTEGQDVLRQVAQVLRQIPDRDFLIAGHTDNIPVPRGARFRDNWELSSQRAVNVARFLQENGLPPQHLGAAGYAEFQPAFQNDSEEHRALNRRVEVVLMPNINELPDLSSLEGGPSSGAAPSGGTSGGGRQ